ncbi:MAG: response regulator [Gammaproteobacteria bacterium]|nr:response regulator [Gammaproteobacteria bacterium]NNF62326.1 response regulator [Gammaproteobacteria bacterium]NNM20890.1 response regulator [Gammaproteobacteria bacterium]
MKRVIVAEDEPYLARMLRLALSRSGYRVQTATDGEVAWELLSQEPPDAFITAATLPTISGVDLCRRIRRELPHRDMPTIIMTGRAEEQTRREAQAMDRVIVLDKPVSIRTLLSELDSFFAGDSMADTLVGEERIR